MFILDFSLELEQEDTDSINKLLYTLNHKREYFHKLDNMFHHTIIVFCPCYYRNIISPHQGPSLLDLQLPVQSVPITTKVVSLNPTHGKV